MKTINHIIYKKVVIGSESNIVKNNEYDNRDDDNNRYKSGDTNECDDEQSDEIVHRAIDDWDDFDDWDDAQSVPNCENCNGQCSNWGCPANENN